MIRTIIITFCIAVLLATNLPAQKDTSDRYKIQIALLLDVSGSMNGLIAQAKSQIWGMVNELSRAEKNKQKPTIQLALGTFGNAEFHENGFFRLCTSLTSDIDLISELLSTLKTGGKEEYCGYAIQSTLDSIKWSENKEDLKIIFIAGNELFNQGPVDYSKACKHALNKRIIVNTIYCGNEQQGVKNLWLDAAKKGKGKYTVINIDSAIKYSETFWDKKIIDFNNKLDSTYIPFGPEGETKLKRQVKQDENAALLGNNFMRDRVIFKASYSYLNAHWDLVDAYKTDSTVLDKITPDYFPDNLKKLANEQRKQYLEQKMKERELYKEGIQTYYEKAQEILKTSNAKLTLDNAIISIIKEQAEKKGFVFK